MNKLQICSAVLLLVVSAPAWSQVARSAPATQPIKHAAANLTGTLLLEMYNADGSAATATDFGNYTNFTPASTWGTYLNYGVFPLGTPPATAQVGSAPSVVNQGGLQYVSFAVPANQPLYFTCLWKAQAIGTVFMRADNAGKGYTLSDNQTQVLQLPYEFALSEFNTARQLVSQYSASGYSFSADANALLLQASAAADNATAATAPAARALASYAALAIIMPLKERLVLEISNTNISQAAPRRDFVLNYEGFGGWTNSAFVPNYERAEKAGFSFVLMNVDWTTVSPAQGAYDWSNMDYQIDQALALGYSVSVDVNDLADNTMPQWVYNLSFDELKTLYYQNAQAFVARYQNKVASIYPIAEVELAQGLYNLAQGAELVSQSLAGARAAAPSMPFGIYLSAAAYVGYQFNAQVQCGCFSSWDLVTYLSANNITADYLGLEMQYGTVFAPLDLQRVYELLSDYHNVARVPILIGETGYSSRSQDYSDASQYYWHDGLTEAAQSEWAEGFLRIAYGLPFINGLNWVHVDGDNIDSATAQACSCLTPFISSLLGTDVFRSDGSPKPSYFVFQSFTNMALEARPNNLAPVITSETPAQDLGAVGGSSVNFNAQAQDPGGNSLTYTWSVDGVVVSTVFGPSYDWLVPLSATGMHVVSVLVSNGFRSAQTTWEISATPGMKPGILFDETHSEQNTINSQTALQLNPQNPGLVCFCELSGYLAQSYQVSRLTQGPITPQVLSGVGVLALAAPDAPLSAAENQAITQFVQQGGGLVFMDHAGVNPAINSLLTPWGIQLNAGVVLSPSGPAGCPGCFLLSSFADSPIPGSNPAFEVGTQAVLLSLARPRRWRRLALRRGAAFRASRPSSPGNPMGHFQ